MKVKLDVGAEIDTLTKDELDDTLDKYAKASEARERERLRGVKYIRAPRIQGTVGNGTIGSYSGIPSGTGIQATIGGPPWGPQQGYAWSIRRIAVGGLANVNATNSDTVGIYRNDNTSPPIAVINASTPHVTFPTLGAVLFGGDSIVIGHVGSQVASNNFGTLASTYIRADFDCIEVPTELLGKLA